MSTVLISSLRNEGPYLLEWVAFHRAIGFDRIVIAHNDCDDGSDQMLSALAGLGWITAIENNPEQGEAPQQSAARRLASDGGLAEGDWVIWLDLDEYLNIHVGDRTVGALVDRLGAVWGMLIPWRLFGDSGNDGVRRRFISPDFVKAAAATQEITWAVKTFFRFGPQINRLDIHRPYLAEGNGLSHDDVLGGSGHAISQKWGPNLRWLSGIKPRSFPRIGREDKGWDLAQINHYGVRTEAMYQLKRLRGRGYWPVDQKTTKTRHTMSLFASFNTNDEDDVSILGWDAKTTELIAEALQNRSVKAAEVLIASQIVSKLNEIDMQKRLVSAPTAAEVVPQETQSAGPPPLPTMWFEKGGSKAVAEAYQGARSILEYGSGGSTVFAARETSADLISIESDEVWADNLVLGLEAEGLMRPNVEVRHVDIGPTRAWGKPASTKPWSQFCDYPLSPWRDPDYSPDVVLIDGRFRAGCFGATLLNAKDHTVILWDDYVDRPEYHLVEEVIKPVALFGRMARFEIEPTSFPPETITRMISWFFNSR